MYILYCYHSHILYLSTTKTKWCGRLMDVSWCAIVLLLVFIVSYICWLAYWNYKAWQNVRDDKEKAEKGLSHCRTPEEELLNDAWLGGIGGYWALSRFDHKTTKKYFMTEYSRRTESCVIGHIFVAVIVALLAICGGLEMACELLQHHPSRF